MRLNDAYLDLEDAKKSRRDMQQQVLMNSGRLAEIDKWRVCGMRALLGLAGIFSFNLLHALDHCRFQQGSELWVEL
jgi:hypothetical protein